MRPWYKIKNAATGEAEIYIYEQIGKDFWGDGIAAKDFVRDLNALDVERIALHINSPGGAVFDGQAIHTALRQHPAEITTYVDSLAASIASVIALAAERVVMARNALFMIHNPAGYAGGSAKDMRQYADLLDTVAETIMGVYEERTGSSREEIAAAMEAETWYTAERAFAAGFVDEISAPLAVAASWDPAAFAALGFKHTPASIAAIFTAAAPHYGADAASRIAAGRAIDARRLRAAGRVLSNKNETDLRDARDLIDGVLDQMGESARSGEKPASSAEGLEAGAAEATPTPPRVFVPGLGYFNFPGRERT
jgi:ATP-dependent protease ClpP protease subunit